MREPDSINFIHFRPDLRGTGRIFDRSKNLTGDFIRTRNRAIFSLCSHGTGLKFNLCQRFYHLFMRRALVYEIQNGVKKEVRVRVRALQKFRRPRCSQRAG